MQELQTSPGITKPHATAAETAAACDLLKRGSDNFNAAQPNMAAGASINRDGANQILSYIGDIVPRLASLITRLKCAH